jgi:hypothetical protein
VSPDAIAENEACEAVILEYKAIMVQAGIAAPIIKLADELAGRIALRRYLRKRDQPQPARAAKEERR